jgi:hypothetical protein
MTAICAKQTYLMKPRTSALSVARRMNLAPVRGGVAMPNSAEPEWLVLFGRDGDLGEDALGAKGALRDRRSSG